MIEETLRRHIVAERAHDEAGYHEEEVNACGADDKWFAHYMESKNSERCDGANKLYRFDFSQNLSSSRWLIFTMGAFCRAIILP